jgi:hypothetical protein
VFDSYFFAVLVGSFTASSVANSTFDLTDVFVVDDVPRLRIIDSRSARVLSISCAS